MTDGAPKTIAIEHDEYEAKYVGRTRDGRQFFLTTPFVPAMQGVGGAEFIALYLFDQSGRLLDAMVDHLGTRATMDREAGRAIIKRRLEDLGEVEYGRIEIGPFSVEKFGTTFGIIVREPEDEESGWAATVEPGDYMAFFPPWDSGIYDT